MTEKMYEELKRSVFDAGVDAIEDLLGYGLGVEENEEDDTIMTDFIFDLSSLMDDVINQMPEENALKFYNKYCGRQ